MSQKGHLWLSQISKNISEGSEEMVSPWGDANGVFPLFPWLSPLEL